VQLGDDDLALLLVLDVEPLLEVGGRREQVGQQEVEQRPQFVQVILSQPRHHHQHNSVIAMQVSTSSSTAFTCMDGAHAPAAACL